VEFTYNNSNQAMIGMAPYEEMYGQKCWTPVCWEEVRDTKLMGLELVQITTEKVKVIRERMKAAQVRQKRYTDNKRRSFEFEVANQVFLKVASWKNIMWFVIKKS